MAGAGQIILIVALFALFAPSVPAQLDSEDVDMDRFRAKREYEKHDFNLSDFVKCSVQFGQMKSRYYVGEPVVAPLVVSNHTRFPISVSTNFIPRSHLTVEIRPEGQRKRRYRGPLQVGFYAPQEFFVYPLEEIEHPFLIWGDNDTPSGLAFPEPGEYTIEMTLRISVPEASISDRIIRFPTFVLEITEPEPNLAPLIDTIRDVKGFVPLHLKRLPQGWDDQKVQGLIKEHGANALVPYLYFALAEYFHGRMLEAKEEDRRLIDNALLSYQYAGMSDSAFKFGAYMEVLAMCEELELPKQSAIVCRKLMEVAPRHMAGHFAENPLFRKYLGMNKEIEPKEHWTVLR